MHQALLLMVIKAVITGRDEKTGAKGNSVGDNPPHSIESDTVEP